MIDTLSKPYYLPQIKAPSEAILTGLNSHGIKYDMFKVNPEMLNPSQGFVYSDGVMNVDTDKPVWTDNNMNILDGHHKWTKALSNDGLINVIKVDLNHNDACRLLNKLQDIYDYQRIQEKENDVDEVVAQDAINADNQIDSGISTEEFLSSLEENNESLPNDNDVDNKRIVTAYRKAPIKEESIIGNFFTLEPMKDYNGYEIEFDNPLDINELGIVVKNGQNPIDVLSKIWFPNINFEKLSDNYGIQPINLKIKAITEKAKKHKYDGIIYNKLIQGFK